jgi:hypothetical protein
VREPPRGVVYGAHPNRSEEALTIDDAIRDLLDVSTDITAVVVLDESGDVVASVPGPSGEAAGEVVQALWTAASRRAAPAGLEHLVVPVPGGAVAVVQAHGHRALAVTGPGPAVALLLFDLRTCLGDAYAALGEAS